MTEGWKCPVCGRGVAPSEKTCDHGGGIAAIPLPHPFELTTTELQNLYRTSRRFAV